VNDLFLKIPQVQSGFTYVPYEDLVHRNANPPSICLMNRCRRPDDSVCINTLGLECLCPFALDARTSVRFPPGYVVSRFIQGLISLRFFFARPLPPSPPPWSFPQSAFLFCFAHLIRLVAVQSSLCGVEPTKPSPRLCPLGGNPTLNMKSLRLALSCIRSLVPAHCANSPPPRFPSAIVLSCPPRNRSSACAL